MDSVEQLIQIPAQVTDFKPMADKSWKLVFNTRELMGSEVALLADNFQGEGWLVFKPNSDNIGEEDIPDNNAESGTKTPGQRLRAKIYILWKSKGSKGDFESYYRAFIQRFIDKIDEQLT